jgi:hypothetical protein
MKVFLPFIIIIFVTGKLAAQDSIKLRNNNAITPFEKENKKKRVKFVITTNTLAYGGIKIIRKAAFISSMIIKNGCR